MNRELIEDLHQYFEQKENKTGEEISFLNQLTAELPYFRISSVHRDDLARQGFDVSDVDDEDMRMLARKLEDDYCEQLFWLSMEIIADQGLEIPRHVCPKCGNAANRYDSSDKTFNCGSCGNNWKLTEPTGRYVKVEFPDDSRFFLNSEIGYDCCYSKDNGAMYVPEHFYIAHTNKEPDAGNIFFPITWPESQFYFELIYEEESQFELCEPIEHGKALKDFAEQAIWVPLCLIKQQNKNNG